MKIYKTNIFSCSNHYLCHSKYKRTNYQRFCIIKRWCFL